MYSFLLDSVVGASLGAAATESNYTADCFVTSERAYNEVLARCRRTDGVTTSGYLGVGPCQNLIYVGALRPRFTLVVDSRIDNLLEHLMFKLLFERAGSPLEYLALLFSRDLDPTAPDPAARGGDGTGRTELDPDDLVAAFEALPVSRERYRHTQDWLDGAAGDRWPLTDEHRRRLRRLHAEFFTRQLDITSVNESALAALNEIPTLREVITARTSNGVNLHFLTGTDRFRYVKAMHAADRIVPMLGNITDRTTVDRVNTVLADVGERLDTIYLSNLEEFLLSRYLIDDGGVVAEPNPAGLLDGGHRQAYDTLVNSLSRLHAAPDAVLVRFFFPGRFGDRQVGFFPHLEPDVRPLSDYLDRYRADRPESVLMTYL